MTNGQENRGADVGANANDLNLKKLVRGFYSARSSVYDNLGGCFMDKDANKLWVLTLAMLMNMTKLSGSERVLDVATGSGALPVYMATKCAEVAGVDLTLPMLAEAVKNRSRQKLTNTAFFNADAEMLPFPDSCFDLVTCQRAFHHFANCGKVLLEMKRVLRSGGQVVIGNPVCPENEEDCSLVNTLFRTINPAFNKFYSVSECQRLFERAGLRAFTAKTLNLKINLHDTLFVWSNEPLTHPEKLPSMLELMKEILGGADEPARERLSILTDSMKLPYSVVSGFK